MTRKHYRMIAEAIYCARPSDGMSHDWSVGCNSAREVVARKVADWLDLNEKNFDRARFLKACGVPE
jgi:hypothetical protein